MAPIETVPEYPLPWQCFEKRSGIIIKDAAGTSVMTLPFTGEASKDAKRRAAQLVLRAVNGSASGPAATIRLASERAQRWSSVA